MLTIGQMARVFGITAKTLRHYETVDVFRPAQYGRDNGYRYYAPAQISTLRRILWLRARGRVDIQFGPIPSGFQAKRMLDSVALLVKAPALTASHALPARVLLGTHPPN